MIKCAETKTCKDLMYKLGRYDKMKLLKNSNLTLRERRVMSLRFISGYTAKETADFLNYDYDTFNQYQKKIYVKLYTWIELNKNTLDFIKPTE